MDSIEAQGWGSHPLQVTGCTTRLYKLEFSAVVKLKISHIYGHVAWN
jgi:hypothetical protein